MHDNPTTVAEFFDRSPAGLEIYSAVAESFPVDDPPQVRVSKSQIAFRDRRGFAYLWRPDRYLRSDVPAVLSLALPERADAPRVKEATAIAGGKWMHHIEIHGPAEIDAEVRDLLAAARAAAR